jgi:hypothetical protein
MDPVGHDPPDASSNAQDDETVARSITIGALGRSSGPAGAAAIRATVLASPVTVPRTA